MPERYFQLLSNLARLWKMTEVRIKKCPNVHFKTNYWEIGGFFVKRQKRDLLILHIYCGSARFCEHPFFNNLSYWKRIIYMVSWSCNQTEQPHGFENLFEDLNGLPHHSIWVSVAHFSGQILFHAFRGVSEAPGMECLFPMIRKQALFCFS